MIVIDHVRDRSLGPRVEPLDREERALPAVVGDRLAEGAEAVAEIGLSVARVGLNSFSSTTSSIRRLGHVLALLFGDEPDESRASPAEVRRQDLGRACRRDRRRTPP